MDITLIQSTISGLKTASDIARSLLELKSISDIQGKVIELQSSILAAQSSALAANSDQAAMAEEIRALKKELADVKAWEAEKLRYELKALESGVFAYALKSEASATEPPHWLCSRCYNEGRKSLLQSDGDQWGSTKYLCHLCQSSISVKSSIQPSF